MIIATLLNYLYILCFNPYEYPVRLMVFVSNMLKETEKPYHLIMSFYESTNINIMKEARLC